MSPSPFVFATYEKKRKLMISDIWEQFVNYEWRADLFQRSDRLWTD